MVAPVAGDLPDGTHRVRGGLLVALLGASYIINSVDRQALPAVLGPISSEFGLSLSQAGLLGTAFALNIAVFGAFGAWFMRRLGRKKTLLGGMLFFSLFTLLTPLAGNYRSLVTYRALTGAGEALHIAAMFSCVGAYFGARRGMYIGIVNACFGIGAFIGPVLATGLLGMSGSWRTGFYLFGIGGFILAGIIALTIPAHFTEARDTEGMRTATSGASGHVFNLNVLLAAAVFALVGLGFFAFVALYATYLRVALGFSTAAASGLFGLYGIGTLTGVIGGWLGDRWGTRGLRSALVLLALVGYFLFHAPALFWLQGSLAVAYGALVSGYLYPRLLAVLQRSVAAEHVNAAVPIGMVAFYSPGFFAGLLFGRAAESLGWHDASLLVIVLPAVAALLLTLMYRSAQSRGA